MARGPQREPDVGAISLQPGSWDCPNIILPFAPGKDTSGYVQKCPLLVLGTRQEREDKPPYPGSSQSGGEDRPPPGEQHSTGLLGEEGGWCQKPAQGTQVTRGVGGSGFQKAYCLLGPFGQDSWGPASRNSGNCHHLRGACQPTTKTLSCVSALSERLGRAFCAQSSERHVTQRGTEDQGRERLVQTTQHIPRGLSRA